MSVFITFAAALLIFGAVIAIHEFGHFAVAKLCGVQVNEFSIGMGPTLIKTYRKGTQYTLRLLPVGGFVALEGEESPESEQAEGGSGDDDGPDIPPEVLAQRTGKPLNKAAVWQRMLVMAAGAVMNFVLGFVVLLLLISLRSEPITSKVIYAVEDNALCGQTGFNSFQFFTDMRAVFFIKCCCQYLYRLICSAFGHSLFNCSRASLRSCNHIHAGYCSTGSLHICHSCTESFRQTE